MRLAELQHRPIAEEEEGEEGTRTQERERRGQGAVEEEWEEGRGRVGCEEEVEDGVASLMGRCGQRCVGG